VVAGKSASVAVHVIDVPAAAHATVTGVLKREVRSRAIAVSTGDRFTGGWPCRSRQPDAVSAHTMVRRNHTEDLLTRRKVNES